MSRSIGFSHRMALCALAAAVISSTWVSVEEAIRTASTPPSASTSPDRRPPPGSHAPRPPPPPPADARRTPRPARPSACAARLSACIRPMRPQPRTANRIMPASQVPPADEPSAGVLSNGGGDVTRQAPRQTSPAPTNDHGADGDVSLREPLARGRKSGPCVGAIRPLIRFVPILLVERATIYPGALGATGCIY